MTNDNANTYVYDAEGRICAVKSAPVEGISTMTGYIYDGEGRRVAKGTITSMNCDPASNGFVQSSDSTYVLGQGGEELTQLSGTGVWQRTNVYGAGRQVATYDVATNPAYSSGSGPTLHFQIEDGLGTRRMQTNADGQPETDIASLPYGDALATANDEYAPATADDATPLHFTSKERDAESGNDYFTARYYSSAMGSFTSPDPVIQNNLRLLNPQRWNKYAYVIDNPLILTDPTGLDAIAVDFSTKAVGLGHVGIISVHSDGSARFGDFGPKKGGMPVWRGATRDLPLNTKVEFGPDGKPTQASIDALKQEVAGKEGVSSNTVGLADFKTTDAEASNLDNWMAEQASRLRWSVYDVGDDLWNQDCRDYLREGMNAAGLSFPRAQYLAPPNMLFQLLSIEAGADSSPKGKGTLRICDENGKNCH